jgi:UDP-glucose 4-epimerase
MNRYLVTGGAGFVGSNLVDELVKQDHRVVIWDNLSTGKMSNVNDRAEFHNVNVEEIIPDTFDGGGKKGFDAIFHLAGEARIQPSFEDPSKCHDSNVTGTLKLLAYAKRIESQIVYAGSSSVYHDPFANPYSFTKYQAEQYCKLFNKVYDVPVAIARFFNVYGPRQLSEGAYATVVGIFEAQKYSGKSLTITGDGKQRRDFTHVSDIVSGLIEISKQKWNGEIFNLGCGKNYSINELAKMFHQRYEYIPKRRGEAETTLADIRFTRAKLDWAPSIYLEDYVKQWLEGLM